MNKVIIVKATIAFLVTMAIVVVIACEFAYTEEDERVAAGGAEAANPTAVVNFQDIRYRYFDLKDGAEENSFETEGAYMFNPRLKFTNELRGVNTNRSGEWETDPQQLKLKGILLTDGKPLGIKAKYALGVEWLKDLGNLKRGTGNGADMIAPLAGIGWVPNEKVFFVTLVQYFHSYDTHDGGKNVRLTGPRLIYIRKIPQMKGWFKADYKGSIDHENDNDFDSILELQLGKMFTPRTGVYAEGFIGDNVLSTDEYDSAVGLGVRFMY